MPPVRRPSIINPSYGSADRERSGFLLNGLITEEPLGQDSPMTNFRRQILVKTLMLFDLAILAFSYLVLAVGIWHLTNSILRLLPLHAG